jgi:hypothetical protein
MWTLFEPVHIVTYFSPEARAAFEAAGLRGFWRGYFAGRAAPLGPAEAAPVTGAFFSFAAPMVTRALPAVWQLAAPAQALTARTAGAVAALRRLAPQAWPPEPAPAHAAPAQAAPAPASTAPASTAGTGTTGTGTTGTGTTGAGPGQAGTAHARTAASQTPEPGTAQAGTAHGGTAQAVAEQAVAEAAGLLAAATDGLDCAGRVLAAANAALPPADDPFARLWQAATLLREHRGDGHTAALVAAGLDGCEALALRAGLDLSRELLQPIRGWTDAEWDQAVRRLGRRGWLDPAGQATPAGQAAYQAVEDATDLAAARPWQLLGPARTQRLARLLYPLATASAAGLPFPNPVGLPAPVPG